MFASPPAGPRAPRSLPGRSGCNEALLNTRLQVWVDRSFPLLWVSTKARGCWIVRYECAQSREKLPAQLRRFAPPRALSDGPLAPHLAGPPARYVLTTPPGVRRRLLGVLTGVSLTTRGTEHLFTRLLAVSTPSL